MSYAIASVIERIAEALKRKGSEIVANGRTKFNKLINTFVRIQRTLSKEDKAINMAETIAVAVQKIQSSLEDSLSTQSLFLELLSALSIVIALVITWWS